MTFVNACHDINIGLRKTRPVKKRFPMLNKVFKHINSEHRNLNTPKSTYNIDIIVVSTVNTILLIFFAHHLNSTKKFLHLIKALKTES